MSEQQPKPKASGRKRTAGIIGGLAFLAGLILAIIGGIIARDNGSIVLALVVLGLIVALLNISVKEVMPVMVASIALIVAGGANIFTPLDGLIKGLGAASNGIVTDLAVFMVPVAIISAVRAVNALARPGE